MGIKKSKNKASGEIYYFLGNIDLTENINDIIKENKTKSEIKSSDKYKKVAEKLVEENNELVRLIEKINDDLYKTRDELSLINRTVKKFFNLYIKEKYIFDEMFNNIVLEDFARIRK
jgi:predicted nuclease with TOPRIM domain